MEVAHLANGLALWLCLVALLSFHEYAHAWTANRCGDDTARLMGRMTVNPIVHIDPIGTVLIPLIMIMMPSGIAIFGWAKPVPVNPHNLGHRKRDDILISMAGPAMNLALALLLVIVALATLIVASEPSGVAVGTDDGTVTGFIAGLGIPSMCMQVASISLILCFFNLIPIPPLDGSHVLKHAMGMSDEMYQSICQYGFIILLLAINFTQLGSYVWQVTQSTLNGMVHMVGWPLEQVGLLS